MVNWEAQRGGFCFLWHSKALASVGGESTGTWGQDTWPHHPQLGIQGRDPSGCIGTDGVGAMNIQAVHLV